MALILAFFFVKWAATPEMTSEVQDSPSAVTRAAPRAAPLLEVRDLKMHFPVRGGLFLRAQAVLKALDGVSLSIGRGETLALAGESGCGKSTLGKCIARLYEPTSGKILFDGRDLTKLSQHALKPIRRDIQMIFQDPAQSLNPRFTVGDILEEPFAIHKIGKPSERRALVAKLLADVGLDAGAQGRFPFEFSGGQRQRIGIARALALRPKLVICDEPVSALDVSVQSQIVNLLVDLQQKFALSYLFVAHDLAVVRHICDRVAIMYLGKIVETADADELFNHPLHAYTKALLAAVPRPDPRAPIAERILRGEIPSPIDIGEGCAFASRSPLKHTDAQARVASLWKEARPGHFVEVHPATVENWAEYLGEDERRRFEG
jgi:oligopeptide/dipeptide ABC transporter ATP-binding protein